MPASDKKKKKDGSWTRGSSDGPPASGNNKRRLVRHREVHTVEDIDLDSGLNMPHIPAMSHVHPKTTNDKDAERCIEKCTDPMDLRGDRMNVCLLMLLYILQGIPLGLAASVPYLLQSRKVSYKDQAMFSFVYWPFSVKLLWAPIVDGAYFAAFGRRKSWLVPVQYLIGFFMFVLSYHVTDLIEGPSVSIFTLTVVFFMLNFLAATQDIAVDGWALTMLSRRNIGWASTCNSVGQTTGYFMGHVIFLALESADLCNEYIRWTPQPTGIITLADFLYFWSIIFLITTTLVAILKRETDVAEVNTKLDDVALVDSEQGVWETYQLLLKIVRLPSVLSLMGVLLTVKIGFAATDAVTGLKLIEGGVPRDKLAMLAVPLVPIQIILPLMISKYTSGPRPLDIYIKAYFPRLVMGLVFAVVVWWTPSTRIREGEYSMTFYLVVIFVYSIQQVFLNAMFVSQMAFYAQVSDPIIGGTYMTLLNTITNLGGNWPSTVALWLVDGLTWKSCSKGDMPSNTAAEKEACTAVGGAPVTIWDGYYLETIICFILGIVWLLWKARTIRRLQDLPAKAWTCLS